MRTVRLRRERRPGRRCCCRKCRESRTASREPRPQTATAAATATATANRVSVRNGDRDRVRGGGGFGGDPYHDSLRVVHEVERRIAGGTTVVKGKPAFGRSLRDP